MHTNCKQNAHHLPNGGLGALPSEQLRARAVAAQVPACTCCHNLLTATPVEAALAIALAVDTARGLLSLLLACKRFADKTIAVQVAGGARGATPAGLPLEMLSIVQKAARQWFAECTEQERGWVPRRGLESYLGLMHEIQVLRLPLVFGHAHAGLVLTGQGWPQFGRQVATIRPVEASAYPLEGQGGTLAATSKVVMRAGRHFAQFRVGPPDLARFYDAATASSFEDRVEDWADESSQLFARCGVVNAGFNPTIDHSLWYSPECQDGHCFYSAWDGERYPGAIEAPNRSADDFVAGPHNNNGGWLGMQDARMPDDCIGMLLDLDEGTMTVFKNGRRLGVMTKGLTGKKSWAVCLGVAEGPEGGIGGCTAGFDSIEGNALP
jgi:hypothetical protein